MTSVIRIRVSNIWGMCRMNGDRSGHQSGRGRAEKTFTKGAPQLPLANRDWCGSNPNVDTRGTLQPLQSAEWARRHARFLQKTP
jgi:hypothetical protein